MRYAFKDLGERPAGTEITVRLEGSAANVLLLDAYNYSRYRAAGPFRYSGGLYHRSPVRLRIPRDGHWHLVVDLGGHRGRVRAHIEQITEPDRMRRSSSKTSRPGDPVLETVS